MDDGYAIPAATVRDVDLSGVDPALAAEIRRLGDLMERGEETPEQFSELVRLVLGAGHSTKAEYLLRRNLEGVANGPALYRDLFGTEKPDEFATAIEAFGEQFGVELELVENRDFLDQVYHTRAGSPRWDVFRLLGKPCEVRFDYGDPDAVAADVSSLSDDEYLLMQWVDGVWEPAN
jgi:hypothetical protein